MGAHWDSGAFRPRRGRAAKGSGYPRGGSPPKPPRRSGGWSPGGDFSGGDSNRAILPLALSLSAAVFWGVWTLSAPGTQVALEPDSESGSFEYCHSGGGFNCVVDGDTFHYQGAKIRIADIDTPETHPPRCEAEATKGAAATRRLQALLNTGQFTLAPIDRDEDTYGRKLRIVTRGGESLGGVLVDEGLARWYAGGRQG